MKIKMRLIEECLECGYRYTAPPWEPTLLGKIAYWQGHEKYHEAKAPEFNELAIAWREWEQDRIIALIESSAIGSYADAQEIIALIKADN